LFRSEIDDHTLLGKPVQRCQSRKLDFACQICEHFNLRVQTALS
jgi:hypothetical protein